MNFTSLCCHGVLLHERLLGEVELEWVVRGQVDLHALPEVLGEGVLVVIDEEAVVAEWRHAYVDLRQVVEVVDHGHL